MIFIMNLDVWKLFVIFSVIAIGTNGKPYKKNLNNSSAIVKRVEISDNKGYKENQSSVRRQNVIHAGNEYDDDKPTNEPEPDELENLGKIIDYNGKIIDSAKSTVAKWKDAPGISKDVIERIKEIQDTLIKRTGTKDLAEKLKLMQPEKNITISSGSATPLNSRKVIPEDVVNKILDKFQELRQQAKTLASLDEDKAKVDGKDGSEKPVETDTNKQEKSNESSVADDKKAVKVESQHGKQKSSSPYESIGPPKDNEEVRNITQSGVTEVPQNGMQPSDQQSGAPGTPSASDENDRINQQPVQTPDKMEGSQQNMPGNMMMTGSKVPMMFIKQGEMLVPVYGNQDGANQQYQQSAPPVMQAPQMMPSAGLIPQQSATQAGQSRSVPQTYNSQHVQIPSVPLSAIMSLMSGPKMISNLPASPMIPPQMNGGVYNVPQGPAMNQAGFIPQYQPGVISNQPSGDVSGAARQVLPEQDPSGGRDFMNEYQGQGGSFGGQGGSFGGQGGSFGGPSLPFQGPGSPFPMQSGPQDQSSFQGQLSQFQRQFSPFQEQGSPFEEKPVQPTGNFMGGFPGQSNAMGNPGPSMGFGLAMDQSGKLSTVNPMNSAMMPEQPTGPLQGNPFQDTHPEARNNMEVMDKEKQMLSPYMANPVNDLSDPMPNDDIPANTRNLNPDALLELAKSRKTDPDTSENPESNPDSLLDNLKQGQLSRELTGPGDPDRIGMNGMMTAPPSNQFSGTNPETLLDMLSKRNSKQILSKDTMELERNSQNRLMEKLRQADQGLRRGSITPIGTNGMQGISSLPVLGQAGLDPSLADYTSNMIGNQAVDVGSKSVALNNPVESSFFGASQNQNRRYQHGYKPNRLDVLSQDSLRFEHSRNAIDSGDDVNPVNQADIYARHRISSPDITGSKRSMESSSLHHDNIELRVNGQALAEKGSLRSKIINGKIKKGKGKILTSKSPVKIELSHADDAKKTKIVNIVTTGKYQVTDSKRDNVIKHDKFLKKFYRRT